MKKLYEYLLNSEYYLERYFGDKSFIFKKENGDWSKTVYISKYGKEYDVTIIEGLPNMIKQTKNKFKTYKEVIALLS